ncbi:hypothetical protein DITRI_Ditri01bG0145400 [Diplodiscus trichospermus]
MTKKRQIYISWRIYTDPAPGPFSLGLDPNGTSTYHILQNGNIYWTCGIWLQRVSSFSTGIVDIKYTTLKAAGCSNLYGKMILRNGKQFRQNPTIWANTDINVKSMVSVDIMEPAISSV